MTSAKVSLSLFPTSRCSRIGLLKLLFWSYILFYKYWISRRIRVRYCGTISLLTFCYSYNFHCWFCCFLHFCCFLYGFPIFSFICCSGFHFSTSFCYYCVGSWWNESWGSDCFSLFFFSFLIQLSSVASVLISFRGSGPFFLDFIACFKLTYSYFFVSSFYSGSTIAYFISLFCFRSLFAGNLLVDSNSCISVMGNN